MRWNVNDMQEHHFSPFATQFCCNIVQYFFLLIEKFMQVGPADWPVLPNAFECMKSVSYLKYSRTSSMTRRQMHRSPHHDVTERRLLPARRTPGYPRLTQD